MPVTAAALVAGEVSTDQVDLLARANQPWRDESFADHEATLVDHCRRLRFTQLQQTIDYWCHHADTAAAERGADVQALQRRCTVWRGEDGEMHVSAVLPKVAGAVLRDELNRLEQHLYRRGGEATQDNGRLLCPGHNRHPDRRNARPKRRREGGCGDDPRAP